MGTVTSLQEFRERRSGARGQIGRLEHAVARLDPAVRRASRSLGPTVERELRAIADAVSRGEPGRAADRAERLLGLLSHPALSG
jgi:hypothetical protein